MSLSLSSLSLSLCRSGVSSAAAGLFSSITSVVDVQTQRLVYNQRDGRWCRWRWRWWWHGDDNQAASVRERRWVTWINGIRSERQSMGLHSHNLFFFFFSFGQTPKKAALPKIALWRHLVVERQRKSPVKHLNRASQKRTGLWYHSYWLFFEFVFYVVLFII